MAIWSSGSADMKLERNFMSLPRISVTHVVFMLLALFCGCGGITEPVSGIVTLDEKPLAGVTVVFSPVEGGRRNSVGTTNESGAYSLDYTIRDTGAMVGQYKVLISKTVMTDKDGEVETLPKKYNSDSIFTAEVTTTGDNKFNFNLESE